MVLESGDENLVVGLRPDFRIEDGRVDDIITMGTAGCGLEIG